MPVIRIVLLLLLIGAILALKVLPWYFNVGIVAVLVLSAKFVGGKLATWLISLPFKAKGAVLKNATAQIHSLKPCAAPAERTLEQDTYQNQDEEEFPDAPEEPRNYYLLDVTIVPQPTKGPFHAWEVGELGLIRPEAKLALDCGDACRVEGLEVFLDGRFMKDEEGSKLPGPQRLRMTLAIKADVPRLVFNYYLEKFGEIDVPRVNQACELPQPK